MVKSTSSPKAGAVYLGPKLKSLRCRVPVAEKPLRVTPLGSVCGAAGPSTVRVTGLVTPARVRSPVIISLPADLVSDVDLKVIVGYLATSKKSGLFRWVSRAASWVSTVLASIVTSTEDLVMSFSSSLIVAGAVLDR